MNPKKPVITRRDFVRGSAVAAGAGLTGILKPSGNAAPVDEDELWRVFHEPPISARPFVRWWWNGDKVTAKEILRELDVMKTAGIGGFELNPIRFPDDSDPLNVPVLTWLSPEWSAAAKTASGGAPAPALEK
jgi:hypothetical protein